MRSLNALLRRRTVILRVLFLTPLVSGAWFARGQQAPNSAPQPDRRWFQAAVGMKRLAQTWGDQPYGAVLVLGDQLVGEGPSRVVALADSSAHAEREAIRDAQRRLSRSQLQGSVLYSTSRPCAACEAVAASAGVSRMYFGETLHDAGAPKP